MRKSVFNLVLIILVLFGAYYVLAGISAVTLTSPGDNEINSSNDIVFQCSGTPDGTEAIRNISVGLNNTGNATNQIILNNTNTTLISNSSVLTVLNIPDGRYVWNCLAANNSAIMVLNGSTFITSSPNANGSVGANFSRSANRTLTIDTAQPDIINLSTKENASNNYLLLNSDFTNGSTNLVFSVHDRLSATSTCNVSVNGVVRVLNTVVNSTGTSLNTSANTANNSISVLGFNSGVTNNWSVVCSDNAGNTNSTNVTSVNITISDVVAPVLNGIDQKLRFKGTISGEQNVEGTKFDFGSPVSILGCNGTDNVDFFRTNATVYVKRPGASQFAIERNDTGGISNFEFTDTSALGIYVANCTIRDISGNQNSTVKNFEIIRTTVRGSGAAAIPGFHFSKGKTIVGSDTKNDAGALTPTESSWLFRNGGTVAYLVAGESHSFQVTEIGEGSVTIRVSSNPFDVTVKEDETKNVDVNGDGSADVAITLNGFTPNGNADLTFKEVGAGTPADVGPSGEINGQPTTGPGAIAAGNGMWLVVAIIVVVLVVGYFLIKRR